MKLRKSITSISIVTALFLTGCDNPFSDDDTTATSTTTTSEVTVGETTDVVRGSTDVSALTLPTTIDVITTDESTDRSSFSRNARLFSDANTDYVNAEQRFWVRDDSTGALDTINMIMDFIGQTKYESFVNKGPYIAMVKDNQEDNSGSQSSSQGSGSSTSSQAEDLKEFVMNVTRADENSPMVVQGWIYWEEDDEFSQNISFRLDVAQGVSETYPAGVFTMYIKADTDVNGQTQTIMRNILQVKGGDVVEGNENNIGSVRVLFKDASNHGEGDRIQEAHLYTNADFSNGVAFTKSTVWDDNAQQEAVHDFKLAYNTRYVKVDDLNTSEGEFLLDKQQFDYKVYRYGLFDTSTGAKIERNSGRHIIIEQNGKKYHGYAGYWGIYAPNAITNITDSSLSITDDNGNSFSVYEAPGKLKKHTKVSITLEKMDGIELNMYDSNSNLESIIVWDKDANNGSGAFMKIATQTWGDRAPSRTDLTTPIEITIQNEWDGAWCSSLNSFFQIGKLYKKRDANGNEVSTTPTNTTSLAYFKEATIMPGSSEIPTSSLTVYDGTKYTGTIDANNIDTAITDTWKTIDWNNATLNDFKQTYSFNSDSMTLYSGGTTTDSTKQVIFDTQSVTSELLEQKGIWGIQVSPLLTSTELARIESEELGASIDMNNWWEIHDSAQTYFSWNSGLDEWNKLRILLDTNGNAVSFDQPLEFSYVHSTANDRENLSKNDGKTFLLRYDGQSLELPWIYNEEHNTWMPSFALKDGTLVGDNNEYVVKAIEGEKLLKKVTSVASGETEPDLNLISISETGLDLNIIDTLTWNPEPTDADCTGGLKTKVVKGEIQDSSTCE